MFVLAVLLILILVCGIWIFISSMSKEEPPTCGRT